MDGLRGGLEGIAEDKALPRALELSQPLKEQMHQEIENVGVQLGRRIIDLITRDLPNMHQTQFDIIKFMQTNFWPYVFGKTLDKIKFQAQKEQKCNSYILQDYNNRFLGRISSSAAVLAPPASGAPHQLAQGYLEAVDRQRTYSFYVKGLVKGALINLGAAL